MARRDETKRKWREENKEKVKEQNKRMKEAKKGWVEKNKAKVKETKKRWQEANKEWCREAKKKWRANNKEKMAAYHRKYREQHQEARNEESRRCYHAHKEQRRETKRKLWADNKDRMRARAREYYQEHREACRERSRRYRRKHKDRIREAKRKWWANNPDKVAVHNRKRCERYRANKPTPEKDPPPPLPPCDCGVCLSCGGWSVSWKPEWHARLNAWLGSMTQGPDSVEEVDRGEDQPAMELEDLPTNIIESQAETMSTVSTSEVDSELGDRLETLLADESDSEVETGPASTPTRRSARIATMPPVSYREWEENPMLEILERKARLHSEAADRIVARWMLLEHRSDRMNTIVEEMTPNMDPRHQLDRFQAQLQREEAVMNIAVNEELFDFISGEL